MNDPHLMAMLPTTGAAMSIDGQIAMQLARIATRAKSWRRMYGSLDPLRGRVHVELTEAIDELERLEKSRPAKIPDV